MPCAGSSAWFILKYKLANDGAHWLECCCCCLLQGVRGMRVGGQRRVLVPPELVSLLADRQAAAHDGAADVACSPM